MPSVKPVVLFVVGEPGVGKTTLVRQLLEPDSYLVQKPKWTVGETVCAAGHYTGDKFDGADTVPYNGAEEAINFWLAKLSSKRLTIFDGDRFSNSKVLARLHESGYEFCCALLKLPEDVSAARRAARGSNQNASWVKGRKTKAERFASLFMVQRLLWLNAEQPTGRMASELKQFLEVF